MADVNEPDDLDSDDLNEIDYGDDDDVESVSEHNIALAEQEEGLLNGVEDDDDEEEDDEEDEDEDDLGEKAIEKGKQHRNRESNQDDSDQGKDTGDKSTAERCRYWPACNAGNNCHFYHPTKPCRNFPKCSFGDKCLYIHPPCKFNQNCARSDCPFAHPAVLTAPVAKRRPPASHQHGPLKHHTAHSATPKCKYGLKCNNLMCKFSHEAPDLGPCRYGSNCLLETCSYSHPTDLPRKKPSSVNQFKWEAPS